MIPHATTHQARPPQRRAPHPARVVRPPHPHRRAQRLAGPRGGRGRRCRRAGGPGAARPARRARAGPRPVPAVHHHARGRPRRRSWSSAATRSARPYDAVRSAYRKAAAHRPADWRALQREAGDPVVAELTRRQHARIARRAGLAVREVRRRRRRGGAGRPRLAGGLAPGPPAAAAAGARPPLRLTPPPGSAASPGAGVQWGRAVAACCFAVLSRRPAHRVRRRRHPVPPRRRGAGRRRDDHHPPRRPGDRQLLQGHREGQQGPGRRPGQPADPAALPEPRVRHRPGHQGRGRAARRRVRRAADLGLPGRPGRARAAAGRPRPRTRRDAVREVDRRHGPTPTTCSPRSAPTSSRGRGHRHAPRPTTSSRRAATVLDEWVGRPRRRGQPASTPSSSAPPSRSTPTSPTPVGDAAKSGLLAAGRPRVHRSRCRTTSSASTERVAEASGEPLLEFLAVMRRLRAECPWKREQTHRSLARYLLEETHETLEAIDAGAEPVTGSTCARSSATCCSRSTSTP